MAVWNEFGLLLSLSKGEYLVFSKQNFPKGPQETQPFCLLSIILSFLLEPLRP